MGTNRYDIVRWDDLNTWYTQFNFLVNRYSSGISQLTIPANDRHTVRASEINALHNQILNFQGDHYLGTQIAWWPTGQNVAQNQIVEATQLGAITTVVSNVSRVKCKNEATNYHGGVCPNTPQSNTSNSYGDCNHGDNSNTYKAVMACQSGLYSSGSKANGTRSNETCFFGACTSSTRTYGTNNSGRLSNQWNTNGTYTNVTKYNGSLGTDYTTSGTATYSHLANRNSTYSNGGNNNDKHSNGTNGFDNRSNVPNNHGDKANGRNNYGECQNTQASSRIPYTQCYCGTHVNGTCTSGKNTYGSNTCGSQSNGTNMCGTKANTRTVDITCSLTSKTNQYG